MSHFVKIASVLALSIAAGLAATGCAMPSGEDGVDDARVDQGAPEAMAQGDLLKGGFMESSTIDTGALKGGALKGGGGFFTKVPAAEAPTPQYAPPQGQAYPQIQ